MNEQNAITRIVNRALQDYGYLCEANVRTLAREEEFRLCPVLARFSCCRFTAPAQDVEFLIESVLLHQQRHLYLRDLYIHEEELRRRFELYRENRLRERGLA